MITAPTWGATGGIDADLHRRLADSMDATEADVLFGRGLKPMPMGASATIVRTDTLSLPRPEELSIAHAYANMSWRKRLGHTLYELIGVLAREKFIRDDGRFGALICDEAYHFTASAVGQQIIEEFVRDGRKHQAGIILASHDPVADYSGVAHNLIPNRFGLRHSDKTLAENTLAWLGVDIERNPYLVKQMRYGTSPAEGRKGFVKPNRRGEAFIADSRGRIGRAKLFAPRPRGSRDGGTDHPRAVCEGRRSMTTITALSGWDPAQPTLGQLLARVWIFATATRLRRYTLAPLLLQVAFSVVVLAFPAQAHAVVQARGPNPGRSGRQGRLRRSGRRLRVLHRLRLDLRPGDPRGHGHHLDYPGEPVRRPRRPQRSGWSSTCSTSPCCALWSPPWWRCCRATASRSCPECSPSPRSSLH